MALPFLTEEEVHPAFIGIHLELLGVTDLELELVSSFKKYFIKQWIDEVTTNNVAECYCCSWNAFRLVQTRFHQYLVIMGIL